MSPFKNTFEVDEFVEKFTLGKIEKLVRSLRDKKVWEPLSLEYVKAIMILK